MKWLKKVVNWLTGRDEKEADVYANYDRVEEVTNQLHTIAKRTVGTAQDEIYNAFNTLNNVKGFKEYVGAVAIEKYDSIFDAISDTIDDLANSVDKKASAIKAYEESPWITKIASSMTMGVVKSAEGLLSAFEHIGDSVVSVIGWGAGLFGAKNFQDDCANFIKKEWSHDAFNFYYNSDFAKTSIFTEESGLVGAIKIVGEAHGVLATGLHGLIADGMGKGVEAGLQDGMSYNQAMGHGVKTALAQTATTILGMHLPIVGVPTLGIPTATVAGLAVGDLVANKTNASLPSEVEQAYDNSKKELFEKADEIEVERRQVLITTPDTSPDTAPDTKPEDTDTTPVTSPDTGGESPNPYTPVNPSDPDPNPNPTTPDPKPTDPEPTPTDPEPKPTDPEPKPTDPEPKPTDPEPKPTDPEPKPTDPEPKPTDPEPRPTVPAPRPTDPTPTPNPGDNENKHSGGEFDGEDLKLDELENADGLSELDELEDIDDMNASVDDIIKGSKYQKIPTSQKPIQKNKKSGSNSVIPIAAGLSVAAASGIGAKAYMDYKKNNAAGEDDEYEDEYDDDFSTEDEWQGDEETINLEESNNNEEDLIEFSNDDYYQQEDSGYTARDNASEV